MPKTEIVSDDEPSVTASDDTTSGDTGSVLEADEGDSQTEGHLGQPEVSQGDTEITHTTEADDAQGAAPEEPSPFEEVIASWSQSLSSLLREDARQFVSQRTLLSDVHPGGIAQLYVDHPTRLDTLVREPSALKQVTSRLESLLQTVEKKRELYGRVDVHLSIGTATWDALKAVAGKTAEVPVMLRRVDLSVDDDGMLTLELLPGVEVNSRLLGTLKNAGVNVDPAQLGELMRGPDGFLPGLAFDYLRAAGQALPGFELREEHVLGLYSHPAGATYRQFADVEALKESDLVRALAGDPVAAEAIAIPSIKPNLFDRDPWKELGLGDQSPQELDVVETVAEGASLIANASGRELRIKATASFAAAVAESGRSVLVVTNDSRFRETLMQTFDSHRVSAIVAAPGELDADQDIAERLLEAATDDDMVESDAQVAEFRSELKRSREILAGYTQALHEPFEPWNVSAFQALQVLTDLTSLPNPPTTQVRFAEPILSEISSDGGGRTLDLIRRAFAIGLLDPEGPDSPWRGVRIADVEDVGPMLRSLDRLTSSLLPAIRMQMSTTAARCELRQASTLRLWKKQLTLLSHVRDVLDTFKPEILETSPADLVVATASKQWRRSKNINLKTSQRRDLTRRARDMIRPGVHVEDLHKALVHVQATRLEWAKQSDGDSWPTVPDSIGELESTWAEAQKELAVLRPHLEPVYGDLDDIHVEELDSILQQLYQDPQGALEVPETAALSKELARRGLSPLVEDLRAREVTEDQLSLELDLAWWASALGFMLSADPRLGGLDPAGLQDVLDRTKALDALQVESLGPELVRRVRARGWEALGLYPQQREELIAALTEGTNPLDLFATSNLPWDLMPIVVAAPAQAEVLVGPGRSIDSVIIAGFKELPAAALVPVISRAKQVVVVDDLRNPSAVSELLAKTLPVVDVSTTPPPIGQLAARILESLGREDTHVVVPAPASASQVKFVRSNGRGAPAHNGQTVESSKKEVDLVVSMVRDHLRTSNDSLAVVTLTEGHAEQIRAALLRASSADTELHEALEASGGVDALVGPPDDLDIRTPAKTILSVGFAKTPHGRVVHNFGPLSTPEGARLMERVALTIGDDVVVVSSLGAEDLDEGRLRYPGERALYDLLQLENPGEQPLIEGTDDQEHHEPEQLLQDLAERLHRLGLNVVANLGSDEGIKIPLAIGHPEVPGELLVAVMSDNPAYMAEQSQRVRNTHWSRTLESMGWKVRTVLSMSVFIDPNREAHKIVELTLDAVDEYYARMGLPRTPAAAAALGASEDIGFEEPETIAAPVGTAEAVVPEEVPAETVASESPDAAPPAEASPDENPIDGAEAKSLEIPSDADAVDDITDVGANVVENEGQGEATDAEVEASTAVVRVDEDRDHNAASSAAVIEVVDVDHEDIVTAARTPARGPRPSFARGLPLAAYSDDQLDELALWVRGDSTSLTDEEVVEELRALLGVTRRGAHTDAVLLNVARRTRR